MLWYKYSIFHENISIVTKATMLIVQLEKKLHTYFLPRLSAFHCPLVYTTHLYFESSLIKASVFWDLTIRYASCPEGFYSQGKNCLHWWLEEGKWVPLFYRILWGRKAHSFQSSTAQVLFLLFQTISLISFSNLFHNSYDTSRINILREKPRPRTLGRTRFATN